jgi:hypothetical protein
MPNRQGAAVLGSKHSHGVLTYPAAANVMGPNFDIYQGSP